ncbi:GH36 C-terminal domain-containing protein [Streptomyces sp. NPDC046942]|uniref:GH36 C-terminal domain-containing protein n=1 Tax=Streptomyces sp. NPDC046942 TaxID=3155137 RepID=UPI0034003BF3
MPVHRSDSLRRAIGVVPAHRSQPVAPAVARLDPSARYRDTATGAVHHGAVLLTHGLPLDLAADDHASALVHLVREPR